MRQGRNAWNFFETERDIPRSRFIREKILISLGLWAALAAPALIEALRISLRDYLRRLISRGYCAVHVADKA